MPAESLRAVETALFVVEKTHELGRISGALLARLPGWDRVKAHRYLTTLARLGWLERLNRSEYVLGRRLLSLAPDFRL